MWAESPMWTRSSRIDDTRSFETPNARRCHRPSEQRPEGMSEVGCAETNVLDPTRCCDASLRRDAKIYELACSNIGFKNFCC